MLSLFKGDGAILPLYFHSFSTIFLKILKNICAFVVNKFLSCNFVIFGYAFYILGLA